ncbi:hypothetical protein F5Y15DRAFT_250238 [Xylariaceae sp. FL0016]|nr:hypothetical protein F5Y15DRAFT_250238 [Xylariaceae sp. FL0016]
MYPNASPRIASSTRSAIRRHPVLLAGLLATSLAASFQYNRLSLARNDRRQQQKQASDNPNYYVSVERSGGGI